MSPEAVAQEVDGLSAAGPVSGGERRAGTGDAVRMLLLRYGVVIALLIAIVVFSVAKPSSFFTVGNLQEIFAESAPSLILAAGLALVLVMNDFDLSFGATTNLAMGLAVVLIFRDGIAWPLVILITLLAGVGVGIINGTLIARLGAASFIITLAMSTVVVGVEYAITNQQNILATLPSAFTSLGNGRALLGVSTFFWIAIVLCALVWFLLEKTETGRFMYAIGGNSEAARLAGIPIFKLRLFGFIAVGVTAAIAGILLGAQSGSYAPGIGSAYLLPTYAAVFLGSAAFRPGQFTVHGAVVGVLFLQVINTGLSMLNLSTFLINIVQGVILIAAVLLSRLGRKVA